MQHIKGEGILATFLFSFPCLLNLLTHGFSALKIKKPTAKFMNMLYIEVPLCMYLYTVTA
jgi:sulfite exporter TauE/SafE